MKLGKKKTNFITAILLIAAIFLFFESSIGDLLAFQFPFLIFLLLGIPLIAGVLVLILRLSGAKPNKAGFYYIFPGCFTFFAGAGLLLSFSVTGIVIGGLFLMTGGLILSDILFFKSISN